tara:strand:- start:12514 stop:12708 length:195 start_codon:yes stop_codon:yes gene_type:complete
MNRKKEDSGEKRTRRKNVLDRLFKQELLNLLDRWAKKYDENGFQRAAKVVRIFKQHAKVLIGSL